MVGGRENAQCEGNTFWNTLIRFKLICKSAMQFITIYMWKTASICAPHQSFHCPRLVLISSVHSSPKVILLFGRGPSVPPLLPYSITGLLLLVMQICQRCFQWGQRNERAAKSLLGLRQWRHRPELLTHPDTQTCVHTCTHTPTNTKELGCFK